MIKNSHKAFLMSVGANSPWPFKPLRMTSFAMTIKKSTGKTLAHVQLYYITPTKAYSYKFTTF